jgi:uncharacterized sporulation protein YeaH/YhbH (DUF444 family)
MFVNVFDGRMERIEFDLLQSFQIIIPKFLKRKYLKSKFVEESMENSSEASAE